MERLSRYDIVRFRDQYAVVVESDLLAPDDVIVCVPLVKDYPAVVGLNPVIDVEGAPCVLATRLIASVRRRHLVRVGDATRSGDQIMRALDILLTGF